MHIRWQISNECKFEWKSVAANYGRMEGSKEGERENAAQIATSDLYYESTALNAAGSLLFDTVIKWL